MKRVRNVLIMLVGVLALTGCTMKYQTTMGITSDGKMTFAVVSAFDKEYVNALLSLQEMGNESEESTDTPKEYTDEEIEAMLYTDETETQETAKKLGMEYSRYKQDGFYGVQLSATIDNIETVSSTADASFDLSKIEELETPINQQIMFKKTDNTYTANFVFNPESQTSETTEMEGQVTDPESQKELEEALKNLKYDFSFVVTLPVAPTTHNATSVSEDGKTLTWTFNSDSTQAAQFSFDFVKEQPSTQGGGNTGFTLTDDMKMYIGIAAVALVLIIVIVLFVSKSKKKKAMEPMPLEESSEVSTTPDAMVNSLPNATDVAPTTPMVEASVEATPAEPTPAVTGADETPAAPATPATPEVQTPPVDIMAPQSAVEAQAQTPSPAAPAAPAEPTSESVIQIPKAPAPEVANGSVVSPVIGTTTLGENNGSQTNNTNVQ